MISLGVINRILAAKEPGLKVASIQEDQDQAIVELVVYTGDFQRPLFRFAQMQIETSVIDPNSLVAHAILDSRRPGKRSPPVKDSSWRVPFIREDKRLT